MDLRAFRNVVVTTAMTPDVTDQQFYALTLAALSDVTEGISGHTPSPRSTLTVVRPEQQCAKVIPFPQNRTLRATLRRTLGRKAPAKV